MFTKSSIHIVLNQKCILYLDLEQVDRIRSVTATKGYELPVSTEPAPIYARRIKSTRRPQQKENKFHYIYNSQIYVLRWKYSDWWNRFCPVTFTECLDFTIACCRGSPWLSLHAGQHADVSDAITTVRRE